MPSELLSTILGAITVPNKDWLDYASALANIAMVLTAILAARYGLAQYRHSVKLAEFQAVLNLRDQMNALIKEIYSTPDKSDEQLCRQLLNFAEVYAAALHHGAISGMAKAFVTNLLQDEVVPAVRLVQFEPLIAEARENAPRYQYLLGLLDRGAQTLKR
ncbi:hypothetical protein [Rhizobium sp. YTU87027]|uniref:hypothetical protein n=1 Tax=Rhizobium sp. YTU87027 TaxID=3417741 RepID=UPI003D690562